MTVGITIEREIKSYNLSSQEANIWNCLKISVSPSPSGECMTADIAKKYNMIDKTWCQKKPLMGEIILFYKKLQFYRNFWSIFGLEICLGFFKKKEKKEYNKTRHR